MKKNKDKSSLVLGTKTPQGAEIQDSLKQRIGVLPIFLPKSFEIGLIMNDNHNVVLPFKSAKLNDKNKDLTKEWYIEFWAWSKSENKLKRKRLTTINSYKTIAERENFAYHVIKEINRLLESGYHFDNLKLEKEKAVQEISKIKEHITITDYLNKALEINKNKYNGRTYSDKKHDVKVFADFIKLKQLSYLSFEDFEKKHAVEFQKYLIVKGYAGKTVNCRMSTISTFYNEAIESEIVEKNPFLGIKRMKEVKTSINKAYNDAEIKKIKSVLQENHPEMWLSCMMMFYCFVRPNEIRQLKVKDIDLVNKKIYVGSIVSKNKKSSSVDIPGPLLKLLNEYLLNESEKEKYLFTRDKKPGFQMHGRNSLRDKYESLVKGLNLDSDLTFYSWKHTGVVKAYKAGIDIKALQIQGRWHDLKEMDKYLKSLGLVENTSFTSKMNSIEL